MNKSENVNPLFFVPLTEHEAKIERSYVSGIFAELSKIKKRLFVAEHMLKMQLKKIETRNYLELRKTHTAKDSEKLSTHSSEYYNLHIQYIKHMAERQQIEDYMEAINKKDFAIESIIRSEISDKKLYNSI